MMKSNLPMTVDGNFVARLLFEFMGIKLPKIKNCLDHTMRMDHSNSGVMTFGQPIPIRQEGYLSFLTITSILPVK